ncbi:hypothetical protein NKG05_10575 [Oerskovia sp. M15]
MPAWGWWLIGVGILLVVGLPVVIGGILLARAASDVASTSVTDVESLLAEIEPETEIIEPAPDETAEEPGVVVETQTAEESALEMCEQAALDVVAATASAEPDSQLSDIADVRVLADNLFTEQTPAPGETTVKVLECQGGGTWVDGWVQDVAFGYTQPVDGVETSLYLELVE